MLRGSWYGSLYLLTARYTIAVRRQCDDDDNYVWYDLVTPAPPGAVPHGQGRDFNVTYHLDRGQACEKEFFEDAIFVCIDIEKADHHPRQSGQSEPPLNTITEVGLSFLDSLAWQFG